MPGGTPASDPTYGMETGSSGTRTARKIREGVLHHLISIASARCFSFLRVGGTAGCFTAGRHHEAALLLFLVLISASTCWDPSRQLRFKQRPWVCLIGRNVVLTILFNLFFFWPARGSNEISRPSLVHAGKRIDYILISTCVGHQFLMVSELRVKFTFDKELLRKMLKYSFPSSSGVAGILNQTWIRSFSHALPRCRPNKANRFTSWASTVRTSR